MIDNPPSPSPPLAGILADPDAIWLQNVGLGKIVSQLQSELPHFVRPLLLLPLLSPPLPCALCAVLIHVARPDQLTN